MASVANGHITTNGAVHVGSSESHLQTSPTRALWIGSIPAAVSHADLLNVFTPFGPVESARVLVNKQCGFCNFEQLDDAVRAREALNGTEIFGAEAGPIKIGFAKVPNKAPSGLSAVAGPAEYTNQTRINPAAAYAALKRLDGANAIPLEEQISAGNLENYRSPMALALAANGLNGIGPNTADALTDSLQSVVGLSPSTIATKLGAVSPSAAPPALLTAIASISEQEILMKELSGDPEDVDAATQASAGEWGDVESDHVAPFSCARSRR